MRFSLTTFFAVIGIVLLTACTPITETPAATPTNDLGALPAAGDPVGLLPATAEPSAEPAATMEATDLSDAQQIDTPDLGIMLEIPATWTLDHTDDLMYVIRDENGTSMIQLGAATGFSLEAN